MFARCCVRGLLLLCLGSFGSTLIGCANNGLDSVQVTPATQALVVGQTAQFTATGTFGNAKNLSTQNITTSVTWTSRGSCLAAALLIFPQPVVMTSVHAAADSNMTETAAGRTRNRLVF